MRDSFRINILMFVIFFYAFSATTDASANGSATDYLEEKLELSSHEKLVALKNDPGTTLSPFTTDGCSGGLSIGWKYLANEIQHFQKVHGSKPPWENCCIGHDQEYHTGGSGTTAEESLKLRKEADRQLKQCVLETGLGRTKELSIAYNISEKEVKRLYAIISELMYIAVRCGGVPCSTFSWRWGYGWPECDSLQPTTEP